MKFNSQICTTREQSERLLALGLKKETADCMHTHCWSPEDGITNDIPAWSLGRLLEIVKNCAEPYAQKKDIEITFNLSKDNPYDFLIGEVEWLIKEGYFNKEYLV